MKLYIVQIIGVSILSLLAVIFSKKDSDSGEIKLNKGCIFGVILFLIIIAGFRDIPLNTIGRATDEYRLRNLFNSMVGTPFEITKVGLFNESGSYVLFWLLANLIGDSQSFVLIYSILTITLIVNTFAKNTGKYFPMAMFLFIAGGTFLSTWNLINQFLASAILFNGIKYITDKNRNKYFFTILLASLFHVSAWIMFPLYFISKKSLSTKRVVLIIASVALIIPFTENLIKIVLVNTVYSSYIADLSNRDEGVNILRVLAWNIPYIIVLFNIKKLNSDDRNRGLLYQMLFSGVVLVMSMIYLYFYRLNVYFQLPAIVIVSRLPNLFKKEVRFLITFMMIILFFTFGAYQYSIAHQYTNIIFR